MIACFILFAFPCWLYLSIKQEKEKARNFDATETMVIIYIWEIIREHYVYANTSFLR